MKFDEISQREGALIKDYCISCNQSLRPDAAFCEHCGPPVLPGDVPESGMTFGQAIKKIGLLTLVFAVLVAYKMDWDYQALFNNGLPISQEEKVREIPDDDDLQLFHYVNVPHANIREKPDGKSKVITGAGKGERLIILEKGEQWTQVDLGGKNGWIATRLLDATIE